MPTRRSNVGVVVIGFCIAIVSMSLVVSQTLRSRSTHPATAPTDNVPEQLKPGLRGFSFSPRTTSATDIESFFTAARSSHADIVSWAGDWGELANENGGPGLVLRNAQSGGYKPIIEATAYHDTPDGLELIRPLSDEQRSRYIEAIRQFATRNQPAYLGIGIEVNRLEPDSPHTPNDMQSLFADACETAKAASPHTKVFTSFQYERLKGLQSGLFGARNDRATAQWQLLDEFPCADILAFTSYPSLIYKHPADIPQDYYVELTTHTSKPIALSELGWPAASSIRGWASTADDQAAFITRFRELTSSLTPAFTIWSFLYDPPATEPFSSMGLIDTDNHERPGLTIWNQPYIDDRHSQEPSQASDGGVNTSPDTSEQASPRT